MPIGSKLKHKITEKPEEEPPIQVHRKDVQKINYLKKRVKYDPMKSILEERQRRAQH